MSKLVARIWVPALTVLALAGCGSSSTTSSTSVTVVKTTTSSASPTVSSQVPAAIKAKGTLNVATEAQYAPNEFIAPDGHTIIGMDADLMNALGAVMGLKVNMVNSNFETIIPGLAAGRYDVGASSFTDTKEREKTVDFVDYFNAGISFYAKSSANPGVSTVADLCGKTRRRREGNRRAGRSRSPEQEVHQRRQEGGDGADLHRAERGQPRGLERTRGTRHGRLAGRRLPDQAVRRRVQARRQTYEFAPYGLAIPKTSGMTTPLLAALKLIIANGEYHAILAKWGLTRRGDHDADDQRGEELSGPSGVLERGHQPDRAAR